MVCNDNTGSDNIKVRNSDKKGDCTESTITELEQEIKHLELDRQRRERIRKLKSGELDIEDAEIIPFYYPSDWESYEQYEEIVGGVPGTEGYREVRDE